MNEILRWNTEAWPPRATMWDDYKKIRLMGASIQMKDPLLLNSFIEVHVGGKSLGVVMPSQPGRVLPCIGDICERGLDDQITFWNASGEPLPQSAFKGPLILCLHHS